jgi:hypothetical protein|tara:strand:- start:5848 stop:6369 length:522 start_codon:yes stop_codon:yes gene_type:complete
MRDLIWEIAKAGDEDLSNTELQSVDQPQELIIARGVSLEAKDSTSRINKFVDVKIANDVEEKGALKLGGKVYNFSKSYKTLSVDVRRLIEWATDKQLDDEVVDNLIALVGQNFVPKLRGLDAVAARKGMDKQLARDTFTYKEWDTDPKLQVIDTGLGNAPVWAKKLEEGDRRE